MIPPLRVRRLQSDQHSGGAAGHSAAHHESVFTSVGALLSENLRLQARHMLAGPYNLLPLRKMLPSQYSTRAAVAPQTFALGLVPRAPLYDPLVAPSKSYGSQCPSSSYVA